MSRFARLAEEVLLRHKELAVEHHKTHKLGRGSLETLFLYECILVHSWETGICKKTLKELCEIYDLDYDNSTRRAKTLREKGWLENTKKYLRPLLIHRADEKKTVIVTAKEPDKKTVIITAEPNPETVTVTAKKGDKTVTVTAENCDGYSQSGEKTVTVTVEKAATSNEISGSGDAMTFKDLKSIYDSTTTTQKSVVVVEKNGRKSQFSFEEIQRYVALCEKSGQVVKNRFGLATHLFETGESDALILAKLYPEQPEQTVEYDAAAPETRLHEALDVLIDLSADGLDLSGQKQFYAPEDWAWLMEQLEVYK